MNQNDFDIEEGLRRTIPCLKRYVCKYSTDEVEREELISEALVMIWSKRDKFIPRKDAFKDFTNWCGRVMHNVFINRIRSNAREVPTNGDESIALYCASDLFADNDADISSSLEYIYDFIVSNGRKYDKDIFEAYLQGYKYEEITERLNIPLGTVKNRIFFIKKNLKGQILKVV